MNLDLSTREKEFEALHFPCEKLFDTFEWQTGYLQHWKFDPEKTKLFKRFQSEILQRFQSYQIPVIKLKQSVQKEAVCHVFEKVNTGGVVLNAFELLTATYAAENFRLRDDWYGSAERSVAGAQPAMAAKSVLRGVQNTDFLQAITLIHTFRRHQDDIRLGKSKDEATGVSCKRSAVLVLPKDAYQTLRNHVLTGFPESKIRADGEIAIQAPSISVPQNISRQTPSKAPTITNFTVFKRVLFDKGIIMTGWVFLTSAQKAPSTQYCYYTQNAATFGNVDLDIAKDQKIETPKTIPEGFDMLAAFNRCVWFKGENL